jgi:hypothetical protein
MPRRLGHGCRAALGALWDGSAGCAFHAFSPSLSVPSCPIPPFLSLAQVDADKHRSLGTRFGVSGFPTLKWFPAQTVSVRPRGVCRAVLQFVVRVHE